MDKEQLRQVEWIIEFANTKLDEMGPGDKAKLGVESEEYLFKDRQKKPNKNSIQFWETIRECQGQVWQVLEGFLKPGGSIELSTEASVFLNWNKKFEITIIPHSEYFIDFILLRFYRLLDGLPHSVIQRCPGCNNFFLNPSLRTKRFCSPKCMWKVNAEKKREELKKHPKEYEAYLKKQRETMQKRYEAKIKEVTSNAKIKKRKGV